MSDEEQRDLTPGELRMGTVLAIVRRAYIRVEARAQGRHPRALTASDEQAITEHWARAIENDVRQIGLVMDEARRAGISDALATFKAIETAPPDLVDEAIEVASRKAHDRE